MSGLADLEESLVVLQLFHIPDRRLLSVQTRESKSTVIERMTIKFKNMSKTFAVLRANLW